MNNRKYFSIIDVDNTLFPIEKALLGAVKEKIPEEAKLFDTLVLKNREEHGLRKKIDIYKKEMPTIGKIGSQGILRLAETTHAFNNTPPYKHAKEFLERLIKKSEILWVTARGSRENNNVLYNDAYNTTAKWAKKFSLPYDHLILELNKASFAKTYQEQTGKKPFLFFDDYHYHVELAAAYIPEFKLAMKKFYYNKEFINNNSERVIAIDNHLELIEKLNL